MCVERGSQAVVVELSDIVVGRAKIGSLIHAASCHNSNQFIEKFILLPGNFI